MKKVLCEADLAVMSSRTEGFVQNCLEALSAGKRFKRNDRLVCSSVSKPSILFYQLSLIKRERKGARGFQEPFEQPANQAFFNNCHATTKHTDFY